MLARLRCVCAWAALVACRTADAPTPPSAVERGREIYLHGTTPSGQPIVAVVNGGEVLASRFPCASCHGRDGRGRDEGGVAPSNLRWRSLTRPYPVTTPSGRQHAAYDAHLAIRAITMGFDAAGNRLDAVMPRFQLQASDAADLVAYLGALGSEARDGSEGVTATTLRIGMVVPADDPAAASARAAPAAVAGAFAAINQRGGLYGRQLELHVLAAPRDPIARRAALIRFFEAEPALALTATVVEPDDTSLHELVSERGVPVVCALTQLPPPGASIERYMFYLPAGRTVRADQRAALASAAVLVEALERAGRDVDRDGLIEALEAMREVPIDGLPPVSFGRNRRNGIEASTVGPAPR